MAEPTREEIAQGYANALVIIDGLQRERRELLDALQTARRTIRTWHGMGLGAAEAQAWALYEASPEMQRINAVIAKAKGR